MAINRVFFFKQVRSTLFTGKLTQEQVDGMTVILDEWEQHHAAKDDRWLAYALGTTFHETGFRMQPIHEKGGKEYFRRNYDVTGRNPTRARKMENVNPGDGPLFHGRGFVQLTWRMNYRKMGTIFGVDLTSSETAADGALQPALAAKIMFRGMEDGIFTGRKFAQYFSGTTERWRAARAIINGTDCADVIEGHALKFYAALSYTV